MNILEELDRIDMLIENPSGVCTSGGGDIELCSSKNCNYYLLVRRNNSWIVRYCQRHAYQSLRFCKTILPTRVIKLKEKEIFYLQITRNWKPYV